MCGRYAITATAERIEEAFDAVWEVASLDAGRGTSARASLPRFNVAPTQVAPVVRVTADASARRTVALMRWGLVPSWAQDESIGNRLINARVETAASKPSFRSAWKKRRCLVPITHFYEWRRDGERKQPMAICAAQAGAAARHDAGGGAGASREPGGVADAAALLALAGLWERWHDELESFTILTTQPSDLMRPIHDRMPLILPPARWQQWLDPSWAGPSGADELADWSGPAAAGVLRAYEVATVVNSPRNESPQCLAPIGGGMTALADAAP